ncbi:uncharacterized protein MELLADRAFT_124484 [Melampsora larici-populina 98AG31]|uniref:Secreted protein n=1 Tax=Melampsora larici-populina (strain 98AG31 / pathotype 3-4-7) TaxID=747676 RepID=F4R3T7_MELLP|nr:uncharacterized protein MELLADRAFT_124484 [Melampsora larici-populina 98AG31]EGG12684.1 secreted protein [Melampsora larici-populina 98AG31]
MMAGKDFKLLMVFLVLIALTATNEVLGVKVGTQLIPKCGKSSAKCKQGRPYCIGKNAVCSARGTPKCSRGKPTCN